MLDISFDIDPIAANTKNIVKDELSGNKDDIINI
jgi:hypothetical protein